MGLLHIFLEEVIVTEASVDVIIVRTSVTVVCRILQIIFNQRSTPDGCRTKFADVVEIIDDTLDITSVTSESLAAVSLVRHSFHRVIGRVSVSETVRHDEIDHVGCREACALGRTFSAFCDLVRVFERFAVLGEYDVVCARLCICCDRYIDEKVVWTISLVHLLDRNALAAFHGHVIGRDVLSLHEELERHLHACPP